MERELTNLTFEGWIKFVFDHLVTKREWYWKDGHDWWNPTKSPKLTVAFMTKAFKNPLQTLASYSDAQINQGLWYIADNSCSNHMFALKDESVSWPERKRCFHSFFTLYKDLYLTRCTPTLSHLDEKPSNPLNVTCYMWYDLIPIHGSTTTVRISEEILSVIERTLYIDSDACREGALHGLGHWCYYDPERIKVIVDKFLEQYPNLRPELKEYALRARVGGVM